MPSNTDLSLTSELPELISQEIAKIFGRFLELVPSIAALSLNLK